MGVAAAGLVPAPAGPFSGLPVGLGAAAGELAGAAWDGEAAPVAAWPGLTKLAASRGRLAASPRGPPKRLGRFLP